MTLEKQGDLTKRDYKQFVVGLLIGLLLGIILGFKFALDYGVKIAVQVLDVAIKPEILEEIVLRYGPNVINGFI